MSHGIVKACAVLMVAAAVVAGTGQILAKKPAPGGCPTGRPGCFCPTNYDPVLCTTNSGLECQYSNMCFARCAGFSEGQCEDIGPGPIPAL